MKRLLALCLLAACKREPEVSAPDAAPAVVSTVADEPESAPSSVEDAGANSGSIEGAVEALRVPQAKPPRERTPAAAGKVEIAAGTYLAGSVPGDEGRDPLLEPMQLAMEQTRYSIDVLPFPGEVGKAPQLAQSAAEAAQACQERGARLCSEWEWERACRGPELDLYVSGESWDPVCSKEPATCASGYGARGLGALREWTQGGVRGSAGEGASAHRCARRGAAGEGAAAFRCCYGDPQAPVKLPEIPEQPAFRSQRMEDAELAAIIRTIPELARIAEAPHFLSAEQAAGAYARSETSREGIKFASQPLLWSPERGVEIVVLAGRSKNVGFVLALYPLAGGTYRLASSMLFLHDSQPIALAYRASSRRELLWTSFWGSRTDEGYISWRAEDKRVVIVQK